MRREPILEAPVAAVQARPPRLTGATDAVSRLHARAELYGWDVFTSDLDCVNGTQIFPPKERDARYCTQGCASP
jgi:hypothetical protein